MKIVMAIGAAIILGIVSAIVFLLFLIPVGGLGAVAVIGGMAAGLTWNLYTITLAVVVGTHCDFLFAVCDFSGFGARRGVLSGVFHLFLRLALPRAGRASASCAATRDPTACTARSAAAVADA